MLPRDIGRRVRWPVQIEQDFSFRFREPQPSGNPFQSLDILRLSRQASSSVARIRFRLVSYDVGCHPKHLLHSECAQDRTVQLAIPTETEWIEGGTGSELREQVEAIKRWYRNDWIALDN